MTFKALFIDTNILLHYQNFEQIDWVNIVNAERVELRFPRIVIQELDKHKYSSSSKLRDRATKVIRKLHQLADSGFKVNLKANVDVYFEVNNVTDFAAFNLDPNSQDDKLLASILSFRDEYSDLSVALVAADLGLRLKAKYYQIEAICLPDELRLTVELDQSEKRIKQLEQEVLELKKIAPDLKLCFSSSSDRLNCKIENPFPSDLDLNTIVRRRIAQLKQEHSKLPELESDSQTTNLSSMAIGQMFRSDTPEILPSEISDYNKSLDKFYINYEQYLENYLGWVDIQCRSILVEISISNLGTCPAEDIDIFMHFPDGFILRELSKFPDKPKEPEPPFQPIPKTRQERLSLIMPSPARLALPQISNFLNSQPKVQPNVSSPNIRRSNSYDVKFHVHRLKQNSSESLAPMIVTFDSFEQVSSFRIDYQIIAANVPRPIKKLLHVVVDSKTEG